MMNRNKGVITEKFGRYLDVKKWWNKSKQYGEEEKHWLDERKVMTFEELLERRPWDN